MDLLVIGGSGFLGQRIIRQAQLAGHRVTATFHSSAPGISLNTPVPAAAFNANGPASTCHAGVPATAGVDWHRLDIRRRDEVAALTRQVVPDLIVNAAYVQSDWESTADGAAHIALAAAGTGARLVHVSTDALFSGTRTSYDETCQPDPVTPYGAAKAAAETAVRAINPGAVIARTSLIIGDGDSPHERLVHALAASAVSRVLYTDEVRCPVYVGDLASALLELAASAHAGVCHVAGPDAVSRYELGLLVAGRDGLDERTIPGGRRAADRPGPLDVRLDCARTQAQLDTRLRGAREFLRPATA